MNIKLYLISSVTGSGIVIFFSARQHICLPRYMLSLSACLSIRWVDHTKTVEVRIMKFSPYGSLIPLVLWGNFHPEILRGSPSGGIKQERVGKISSFLSLSVAKVTIND